jgi:processing peptidase subunit beta
MASRRLAYQFNQALRSRAALKSIQPVKRGFATPVGVPSRTQSTTVRRKKSAYPALAIEANANN